MNSHRSDFRKAPPPAAAPPAVFELLATTRAALEANTRELSELRAEVKDTRRAAEARLLTVNDFAEAAALNRRTVRTMIERKQIDVVRFGETGDAIRIPVSELEWQWANRDETALLWGMHPETLEALSPYANRISPHDKRTVQVRLPRTLFS